MFNSGFLYNAIKILIICRLITLGTSRVTRYLLWKHEKRLSSTSSAESANEVSSTRKKRSLMKKYVSVTVGIGLLGLYISRRIRPEYRKPGSVAKQWEIKIYTLLPLRFFSRVMGTVTSIDLPIFLRPKIYSFYANSFGVNLEECQVQDLTCYRNLAEFFIRPIKEECRPIDHDCRSIVSPADGKVLTFGKVTSCQVEQVKGVTYSLQQFLGKQSWRDLNNNENKSTSTLQTDSSPADEEATSYGHKGLGRLLELGGLSSVDEKNDEVDPSENNIYIERLKEKEDTELYQFVVYLAPGDYHRFHSPVSWKVNFRRHFQGKLLSVNPAIASWIANLFSLNERAVYIGSWYHGFFSLTAVGATNVGSIRVQFDPSLRTNQWKLAPNVRDCFFNREDCKGVDGAKGCVGISKGDLFGEFRLGSTVVLIFEAPKNFKFHIETGQKAEFTCSRIKSDVFSFVNFRSAFWFDHIINEDSSQMTEEEDEELKSEYTTAEFTDRRLTINEASNCLTCIGPTFRDINNERIYVYPAYAYLAMEIIRKHLTDISVLPIFTHVVYLDLSENNLRDESLQPLQEMKQLKALIVDKNIIQCVSSVPHLAKLQLLSVRENCLTTCEVRELENLLYLDISYNNISKIVPYLWCPSILPNLTELSLRGNYLERLSGFLFSNLVSLFLAENRITRIEGLQLLPKLKFLHLRKNPLQTLDGFSSANKRLFYINIRDCEVEKLSEFKKLKVLPRLERIVVSGNPFWNEENSRLKLIGALPRLRRINKDLIEDTERQEADKFTDTADDDDGNYDLNDE